MLYCVNINMPLLVAMGKLGAVVGSFAFSAIAQNSSYPLVMGLSCIAAVVGTVLTHFFVDNSVVYESTQIGPKQSPPATTSSTNTSESSIILPGIGLSIMHASDVPNPIL